MHRWHVALLAALAAASSILAGQAHGLVLFLISAVATGALAGAAALPSKKVSRCTNCREICTEGCIVALMTGSPPTTAPRLTRWQADPARRSRSDREPEAARQHLLWGAIGLHCCRSVAWAWTITGVYRWSAGGLESWPRLLLHRLLCSVWFTVPYSKIFSSRLRPEPLV
jgi:hypothetical protein